MREPAVEGNGRIIGRLKAVKELFVAGPAGSRLLSGGPAGSRVCFLHCDGNKRTEGGTAPVLVVEDFRKALDGNGLGKGFLVEGDFLFRIQMHEKLAAAAHDQHDRLRIKFPDRKRILVAFRKNLVDAAVGNLSLIPFRDVPGKNKAALSVSADCNAGQVPLPPAEDERKLTEIPRQIPVRQGGSQVLAVDVYRLYAVNRLQDNAVDAGYRHCLSDRLPAQIELNSDVQRPAGQDDGDKALMDER